MMTLSIPLTPKAEAALRQRAVATGKDPATVASELLTRALTQTTELTLERLEEISGQSYRNFLASGMTDEQLGEELERIKHEDRARKRGITFSE
jgi:hypothetical protein